MPTNIADRYARACSSSNLKVEAREAGDADVLIATGWVGNPQRKQHAKGRQHAGATSLASMLYRLRIAFDRCDKAGLLRLQRSEQQRFCGPLTQEAAASAPNLLTSTASRLQDYCAVQAALRKFVFATASRQRVPLRLSLRDATLIADGVLDYFLDSTCPACKGIKFKLIPGSPHLSNTCCTACDGTGKRKVHFEEKATVEEMALVRDIRDALARKLDAQDRMVGNYLRG